MVTALYGNSNNHNLCLVLSRKYPQNLTTRLNLLKHGGTVICTYVLLLRELRHYKHNLTYNKPLIVDDLVEVDSAIYKYVSFSESATIAIVMKGLRDLSPLIRSWLGSKGSLGLLRE